MHNAPSVMFPVGRCIWYGLALAILALIGACALGAWFWFDAPHERAPWPGLAGMALWLAWATLAVRAWRQAPMGRLSWNASERGDAHARNGAWYWHSATSPEGTALRGVERVLDLQVFALLRLHEADAFTHWVWVERARDPARWNALRRALVSSGA